MKKVFFTGANGFLGTHLISYLRQQNMNFHVHEFAGNIQNFHELKNAFESDTWDYVFHFAGLSHVSDCESDPQKAYEVNVLGTLFLSQLISASHFSGKLFFTSTSLVFDFDNSHKKIEICEDSKLLPKNTYSRTKFYSEKILEGLAHSSVCKVTVLRLFNHTHKSQSSKFILPSVYQQINSAQSGDSIRVGNLDVNRDFSLVSDFCKKFAALLETREESQFQIVNLSSGVTRNLRHIVNLMIQRSGKELRISVDPALLRSTDPEYIMGRFKSSYNSTMSDEEFVDAFLKS